MTRNFWCWAWPSRLFNFVVAIIPIESTFVAVAFCVAKAVIDGEPRTTWRTEFFFRFCWQLGNGLRDANFWFVAIVTIVSTFLVEAVCVAKSIVDRCPSTPCGTAVITRQLWSGSGYLWNGLRDVNFWFVTIVTIVSTCLVEAVCVAKSIVDRSPRTSWGTPITRWWIDHNWWLRSWTWSGLWFTLVTIVSIKSTFLVVAGFFACSIVD